MTAADRKAKLDRVLTDFVRAIATVTLRGEKASWNAVATERKRLHALLAEAEAAVPAPTCKHCGHALHAVWHDDNVYPEWCDNSARLRHQPKEQP